MMGATTVQAPLFAAVSTGPRVLESDEVRLALVSAPAPPAELLASDREQALARVRAARALLRIGDTRDADSPCPRCGSPRIERLVEVAAEGGQRWVAMCSARCRRGASGFAQQARQP